MPGTDELLLVGGGVLAGVVNTISGSGTLFSLGVMAWLNIPLVTANIATRPGVFFQNLAGVFVLRKYRQFSNDDIKRAPIVLVGLGAMLGAICAGLISGSFFNLVASVVMLFLLVQYLLPRGLLKIKALAFQKNNEVIQPVLFFVTGFYGGFIQIGIGILILTLLLRYMALPYAKANAYKLIIILVYTIPTTLYFVITGMILWKPALLLALGQIIGAYLAALFISVSSYAKQWAKWITVMMILITLLKIWVF